MLEPIVNLLMTISLGFGVAIFVGVVTIYFLFMHGIRCYTWSLGTLCWGMWLLVVSVGLSTFGYGGNYIIEFIVLFVLSTLSTIMTGKVKRY